MGGLIVGIGTEGELAAAFFGHAQYPGHEVIADFGLPGAFIAGCVDFGGGVGIPYKFASFAAENTSCS